MKRLLHANEKGYVLVFTLLILVVLMLLGGSAIDTSIFESNMSVNDALYKQSFYQADGGVEIGIKLTFDNAVCVVSHGGFDADSGTQRTIGNLVVTDLDYSIPETLASTVVSDGNRMAAYYYQGTISDTMPHTNLLFNAETKHTPGSGLQMVSGYEGLGASAAAGGSHLEYDIYSQNVGARNSSSSVALGWRLSSHIINNASTTDCEDVYRN